MESDYGVKCFGMSISERRGMSLIVSGQQARQTNIWIDDNGLDRQGVRPSSGGVQGGHGAEAICRKSQGEIPRVSPEVCPTA